MAKKSERLSVSGNSDTIIGTGVSSKGTLISDADIIIDGNFAGDIKAGGNVTLGINSVIKADITAENVTVAGQLEGNINSTGETTIAESGRVQGNITSGLLSVASGAVFIGQSQMAKAQAPIPHPSSATETTQEQG